MSGISLNDPNYKLHPYICMILGMVFTFGICAVYTMFAYDILSIIKCSAIVGVCVQVCYYEK